MINPEALPVGLHPDGYLDATGLVYDGYAEVQRSQSPTSDWAGGRFAKSLIGTVKRYQV